jgi:hypothetical protein
VRAKTAKRKVLVYPAGWQTGAAERTAKPLSSFCPVTGCRRSGGFDGQLAQKKGAVGATKPD